MRRSPLFAATAAAVALVLALGSCSSSGGDSAESTGAPSSVPASTPLAPPTSAAASTPAASGSGVSADEIKAALLTAADLGSGFTEATFQDSPYPLPCAAKGSPPFSKLAPPAASEARRLDADALGASFTEQIRVYADAAGVQHAYGIGMQGLTCSTGTLYTADGSTVPVQISKAQDLTAALGADKAIAWQLQSSQVQVIYVAAVLGRALVLFGFTNSPQADTSKLPDPEQVAKAAVTKIKAS